MAEPESEDPHRQPLRTEMVAHAGEGPSGSSVEDVEREAMPDEPPVPGAQWDEVHRRWEHWDDATQEWIVVGGDRDDGTAPSDENPIPALLARELLHDAELEEVAEHIPDIERAAEPTEGPPGSQWNEVSARWERWDDASGTWVEAT